MKSLFKLLRKHKVTNRNKGVGMSYTTYASPNSNLRRKFRNKILKGGIK